MDVFLLFKVKRYANNQGLGLGTVVKHLGAGFLQYLPREDIEAIDLQDLGDITSLKDLKINPDHVSLAQNLTNCIDELFAPMMKKKIIILILQFYTRIHRGFVGSKLCES